MSDTTSENAEEQLCYWYFICDINDEYNGRTEFEVVKDSLRNIHLEEPDLFPKNPEISGQGIQCFTSEAKMKTAAEYLRNQVHFPFCIHGYPFPAPLRFMPKYLHTFGGAFYRWFEHGWKTDKLGTFENSLGTNESRKSLTQSCSVSDTAVEMVLPSQVFNKEFVFYPSSEEAIKKMGTKEGGKWMLHSPGCMDLHDSNWLNLINSCQEGILMGVKASTTVIKKCDQYVIPGSFCRQDPVIMCYTADSGDIGQVGRAIDAIREVAKSEHILYYKTNFASRSGQYYHEGSKRVSKYMHTVEGELYERDEMRRWKWINY